MWPRPDTAAPVQLRRRELLATGLAAGATLAFGPSFWQRALAAVPAVPGRGPYGPMGEPDANGLRLPEGFSSRLVARGGEPVGASDYVWHRASDGAATFELDEPQGGWVLVSNSEVDESRGGASAIRFSAEGRILDANRILEGTSLNCAGGATPWGTWLSCEEIDRGRVWECDPLARLVDGRIDPAPVVRPAMGVFKHEAVAVDPHEGRVYLTEDQRDGGLYRFTPSSWPDLSAGVLQIATVTRGGKVAWTEVPDPAATSRPTRHQISDSTRFRRGEGIWFDAGRVYVATTDDNRIHVYDTASRTIEVLYDAQAIGAGAPLQGVDNLTASPAGELFACEDNRASDLDVAIVTPDPEGGSPEVARFLSATGSEHARSELTGVVFDPSGRRMYLSSQRALGGVGAVYEVRGPFRTTREPAPHDDSPPSRSPDSSGPALGLLAPRRAELSGFVRNGLRASVDVAEPVTFSAVMTAEIVDRGLSPGTPAKPQLRRLARVAKRVSDAGEVTFRLEPTPAVRRMLRGERSALATLRVAATDRAGNRTIRSRRIRLS